MPEPIECYPFADAANPLRHIGGRQAEYLTRYLATLGAESVIEEPHYFDRDYLAEFAAFYSASARGYPNRCRRLHFFRGNIGRTDLQRMAESSAARDPELDQRYLGFVVLRPIVSAPFGRTVLGWYPDKKQDQPRITAPSRPYVSHLLGRDLSVTGLAWQQQDSAVGACATIALWSILHSSAFDDHHAIPTTADITRAAHRTASLGSRVFPSRGLTIFQIGEAIKDFGLAPVLVTGDQPDEWPDTPRGFSREKFATVCATLIRSGYPVLVGGERENPEQELHAFCITGFREGGSVPTSAKEVAVHDGGIEHVYVHDDNIGPNVRFAIEIDDDRVRLRRSPPDPEAPSSCTSYPRLIPSHIMVAMHEGIRIAPDQLLDRGLGIATSLQLAYNAFAKQATPSAPSRQLALTAQFVKQSSYVGRILAETLKNRPDVLGRTRLALAEEVAPMSLHVGVVRCGDETGPLLDILFDTTDVEHNMQAFCTLVFEAQLAQFAASWSQKPAGANLGSLIKAC